MAQVCTAVFDAGRVPEAFCDRKIKEISAVIQFAFMQITFSHNFQGNRAVKPVKSGDEFHFYHGGMFLSRDNLKHISSHIAVYMLL